MKFTYGILIITMFLYTCQKEKDSEWGSFDPIRMDTVELVYQHFYINELIKEYETKTVYIDRAENKMTIIEFIDDIHIDTTIIRWATHDIFVKRLPLEEGHKCNKATLRKSSPTLGEIVSTQCWTEINDIGVSDSGVEKIYSLTYGPILSRGHFSQYGNLIHSINGKIVSDIEKTNLLGL